MRMQRAKRSYPLGDADRGVVDVEGELTQNAT